MTIAQQMANKPTTVLQSTRKKQSTWLVSGGHCGRYSRKNPQLPPHRPWDIKSIDAKCPKCNQQPRYTSSHQTTEILNEYLEFTIWRRVH